MAKAEAAMPPEKRLDFVVIVTPNHVHYDPAMKALAAGIATLRRKNARRLPLRRLHRRSLSASAT
jgi:hypothetical protein